MLRLAQLGLGILKPIKRITLKPQKEPVFTRTRSDGKKQRIYRTVEKEKTTIGYLGKHLIHLEYFLDNGLDPDPDKFWEAFDNPFPVVTDKKSRHLFIEYVLFSYWGLEKGKDLPAGKKTKLHNFFLEKGYQISKKSIYNDLTEMGIGSEADTINKR